MALSEDQLLKILKEEEADASSFHDSELASQQANAMDRYFGRPYGDEIEGRSKVVTHDVEDMINWAMPKLMRAFMQAEDLVEVDDPRTDEQANAKCASEYLRHQFFKDNPGEEIIHDFCFDALVQKIGVIRVAWEDPEPSPPKVLEGVTAEHIVRYQSDPEYQIIAAEAMEEESAETAEAGGYGGQQAQPINARFRLEVIHKPLMGRAVVENIPPEEFAFSRRARSLKRCDYKRWKREAFLADIIRQFPEAARQLDPDGAVAIDETADRANTDGRADARFPDEPTVEFRGQADQVGRRKVWLIEEEIKVDYDGDGVTELRHVKRVGDIILENEMAERSEFLVWTPIRVAHRMVGRSMADTILDLQRIRTVILRNTLDSMSQSLVPRSVVNTAMVDPEEIDALLDADIGGVIRVRGDVKAAILPLTTPDLTAQGLTMLEYLDQREEEASGVTRHAQGLRAEAITDTKGGIEALQSAANERIEMIARWLSVGLQDVFETILHLNAAHQDQPRWVKVKGKRMEIDPRIWSDEMTVTVSVGMAIENRDTRLTNLNFIAAKQEAILLNAGPANPVVTLSHYRNTLALAAETMGFRNAATFFGEVPEGWQPPPQEDPKVAEAKMKGELEAAKAQQTAQLEQAKAQHKAQLQESELAQKTQMQQIEFAHDVKMKEAQFAFEARLAALEFETERKIAMFKADVDARIAEKRASDDHAAKMTAAKAKSNGKSDANFGGDVG